MTTPTAKPSIDSIGADIQELRWSTDEAMRREWDRSLPFADALFDRWDRAAALGFGTGTSVYDSAAVFGNVVVGEETWIGPNTLLDGSGENLIIGSHCNISAGVQIYTHDSALRCVSLGSLPLSSAAVLIGEGTYIGSQSIIAPGVTIGRRCIVGANSFVNADIEDMSVMAGSPARLIGNVIGEGSDTRIVPLDHASKLSPSRQEQS